jgi:hypothetical protein
MPDRRDSSCCVRPRIRRISARHNARTFGERLFAECPEEIAPDIYQALRSALTRIPSTDMHVAVLDAETRSEVLSSWLSAGVFARFVEHLTASELWSAVLDLRLPPLDLAHVIEQLDRHQGIGDAQIHARTCAHLESLINSIDAPLSPRLTASLSLPWALGRIIDSLMLALEAGAPPLRTASATQPLSLALDRLGVFRVWDLLPAGRGGLAHRAREVPLDVLAGTLESLNLLGAYATSARILVLLLLLSGPSQVENSHRRLLTRLLVSHEARVSSDHVISVWSLANR